MRKVAEIMSEAIRRKAILEQIPKLLDELQGLSLEENIRILHIMSWLAGTYEDWLNYPNLAKEYFEGNGRYESIAEIDIKIGELAKELVLEAEMSFSGVAFTTIFSMLSTLKNCNDYYYYFKDGSYYHIDLDSLNEHRNAFIEEANNIWRERGLR